MKPVLEVLESRLTPDVSVVMSGSTLVVIGDERNNVVLLAPSDDGASLILSADGAITSWPAAAVQFAFVDLRGGNDFADFRATAVGTVLVGGLGNDNLSTFGTRDALIGDAFGSRSTQDGDDNLYSITGPNYVDGGGGRNLITVNVAAIRAAPSPLDPAPTVFGSVTAFPVPAILQGGIVYIQGASGNDSVTVVPAGNGLLTLSVNGAVFSVPQNIIQGFAWLSGAGNDFLFNGSSVRFVAYGGGGNDTFIAVAGDNLFKGGDGGDILVGGTGNDDLSSDLGQGDVVVGGGGVNTLRVKATDAVFSFAADLVALFVTRR